MNNDNNQPNPAAAAAPLSSAQLPVEVDNVKTALQYTFSSIITVRYASKLGAFVAEWTHNKHLRVFWMNHFLHLNMTPAMWEQIVDAAKTKIRHGSLGLTQRDANTLLTEVGRLTFQAIEDDEAAAAADLEDEEEAESESTGGSAMNLDNMAHQAALQVMADDDGVQEPPATAAAASPSAFLPPPNQTEINRRYYADEDPNLDRCPICYEACVEDLVMCVNCQGQAHRNCYQYATQDREPSCERCPFCRAAPWEIE